MLTASWGTSLNGWVICYALVDLTNRCTGADRILRWSQFIYGIGVGGEYPMTSTTALESKASGSSSQTDDKLHRGRNVVLAFLMQGESRDNLSLYVALIYVSRLGSALQPGSSHHPPPHLPPQVGRAVSYLSNDAYYLTAMMSQV